MEWSEAGISRERCVGRGQNVRDFSHYDKDRQCKAIDC